MKRASFLPSQLVDIGSRLKILRKAANRTQQEMATSVYISVSHWSKLEGGIGGISEPLIFTICQKLGVSRRWLVDGIGEPGDIATPRVYPGGAQTGTEVREDMASAEARIEEAVRTAYSILANEGERQGVKTWASLVNTTEEDALVQAVKARMARG